MEPIVSTRIGKDPFTGRNYLDRIAMYLAFSVGDFLNDRASVEVSSHPWWLTPVGFPDNINGRAQVTILEVQLYPHGAGYKVKDQWNEFECEHPPAWLAMSKRFFGVYGEGRYDDVTISYDPKSDRAYLVKAARFEEETPQDSLEGMLDPRFA